MFIHWGLYAIPAGEWEGEPVPDIGEWIMYFARIPVADYEPLARQFNPTRFDAAEWVSLAKQAGQKYIVITTKHHDGFCLFDSKVTDYDIVDATPFGRDPLKELAAECHKQGIKLGFYYSQTQDWHHPHGHGNDWDYVEEEKEFAGYIEHYVKPQVRELLSNYGPIAVMWFDTPMRISEEQSGSLLELCHQLQPDCLVSGRLGNALGDYGCTADNLIPTRAVSADWESPTTMNETWGYKKDDHDWKSTTVLIRKLVDIVSKGGNFLLNVGPRADGTIPEPSVERLLAIGEWLEVNGEAVYGTEPGPIQGESWCRSTAKGDKTFLHVFEWPSDGKIEITCPGLNVSKATLLGDPHGSVLAVTKNAGHVEVVGPASAPDTSDTVVVLVSERE
jgi:alpha-L-fucosidase